MPEVLKCIDFSKDVLMEEALYMAHISYTSADFFEKLSWPLYEKAIDIIKDIAKKEGGTQ